VIAVSWLAAVDPFGGVDPFGVPVDPFASDEAAQPDWGVAMRDVLADARLEATPPRYASAAPTSATLHTVEIGGLLLTVIRAGWRQRDSYQLYACESGNWALVGLFGLYTDALSEIATWRNFVAAGGSLRDWQELHPDGVQGGAR
jgi:hypothetical protein